MFNEKIYCMKKISLIFTIVSLVVYIAGIALPSYATTKSFSKIIVVFENKSVKGDEPCCKCCIDKKCDTSKCNCKQANGGKKCDVQKSCMKDGKCICKCCENCSSSKDGKTCCSTKDEKCKKEKCCTLKK